MTLLEEHLDAELGPGDWVAGYMDVYVYLTPNALAAGPRVKAVARAFLEAQRGVHRVYDVAALVALNAPEDPLDRAVWESAGISTWCRSRSISSAPATCTGGYGTAAPGITTATCRCSSWGRVWRRRGWSSA